MRVSALHRGMVLTSESLGLVRVKYCSQLGWGGIVFVEASLRINESGVPAGRDESMDQSASSIRVSLTNEEARMEAVARP